LSQNVAIWIGKKVLKYRTDVMIFQHTSVIVEHSQFASERVPKAEKKSLTSTAHFVTTDVNLHVNCASDFL
jgi:hypothetical protein